MPKAFLLTMPLRSAAISQRKIYLTSALFAAMLERFSCVPTLPDPDPRNRHIDSPPIAIAIARCTNVSGNAADILVVCACGTRDPRN